MNDAKHSACTSLRASENGPTHTDSSNADVPRDLALEAAIVEASRHPERSALLAHRLAIGLKLPSLLDHARTMPIPLTLDTLNAYLEDWSGGEHGEFHHVSDLMQLLGKSEEVDTMRSVYMDGLQDIGWTAPVEPTEETKSAEANDYCLKAAQLIRVGYLAAIDLLKGILSPVALESAATASEPDESDLLGRWQSNPDPDSLHARALAEVFELEADGWAEEAIATHTYKLAEAPAYGTLLERYNRPSPEPAPGYDLAAFGARCFSAGLIAHEMEMSDKLRQHKSLAVGTGVGKGGL